MHNELTTLGYCHIYGMLPGMGAGTFNLQLDRALANKLRVSSVPSIVAVIAGRPRHYTNNDISVKLIRDFIRELVPETTVTKV